MTDKKPSLDELRSLALIEEGRYKLAEEILHIINNNGSDYMIVKTLRNKLKKEVE